MNDQLKSTRFGQFGYENIGGYFIPYLYRNNEKYCAFAMLLRHIERQEINLARRDLNVFDYLKGYKMYNEEACLLNEINYWHNNGKYNYSFSTIDTLVKMEGVHNFIKHANNSAQKPNVNNSTQKSNANNSSQKSNANHENRIINEQLEWLKEKKRETKRLKRQRHRQRKNGAKNSLQAQNNNVVNS